MKSLQAMAQLLFTSHISTVPVSLQTLGDRLHRHGGTAVPAPQRQRLTFHIHFVQERVLEARDRAATL